ncbi:hypothetical protein O3M35_004104 [Rhynocoris fuscipes]|uniref:SCA7 domain-containing protein n=1 Tax=Rhynocoris fuscipes TaxID=488301 RepID=A0AAW1CKM7_9HEMI
MSNFQELKKFRGQPWSAWTDYIGCRIPPELCEDHVDNFKNDQESQTMLLSRNDIPIFGHCPTAEVFELAVCNYCGDKFKIPALLEHIRNRHQDGQVITTNQETIKSNNDESPRSKSSRKTTTSQRYTSSKKLHKEKVKNRKVNSKPSINSSSITTPVALTNGKCTDSSTPPQSPVQQSGQILQVQVQLDRTKIGCNEKVTVLNAKDSHRNDQSSNNLISPNSPAKIDDQKLKHIRVKLKKKNEERTKPNHLPKELNKEITPVISNTNKTLPIRISQTQCLPELSPSRINNTNEQNRVIITPPASHNNSAGNSYNKLKDRTKESNDHHSQRKDLSDHDKQEKSYSSAINEVHNFNQRKVNTHVPSNKEERKRNQIQKTTERRVGTIGTVRDRTYNPDKHCGVLIKENSKPCTRSLTCKTHSINLRRAVKGRSKTFDVLLADHRRDKEMARTSNIDLNNSTTNITSLPLKKSTPNVPIEHKVEFPEEEIVKFSRSSNNNSNIKDSNKLNEDTLPKTLEQYPQLSLPVSIKPKSFESQTTNTDKKSVITISKTDTPTLNSISFTNTTSSISSSFKSNQYNNLNNIMNSTQNFDTITTKDTAQVKIEKNCQFDGYQQWHPLWRRNRGLLYTSLSQIPRLPTATVPVSEIDSWDNTIVDNVQETPPSCLIHAVEQCTKALLAASNSTASSTVSVPLTTSASNVSTSSLNSINDKNSTIFKRPLSPKCVENYVVFKKLKTQNGQVSVWGPLETEAKEQPKGRPLVQVSINSLIGKNIIPASSVSSSHSILTAIPGSQRTIKLLQTPVGMKPARIHYISASGPIPLTLQQVAIVPQVM